MCCDHVRNVLKSEFLDSTVPNKIHVQFQYFQEYSACEDFEFSTFLQNDCCTDHWHAWRAENAANRTWNLDGENWFFTIDIPFSSNFRQLNRKKMQVNAVYSKKFSYKWIMYELLGDLKLLNFHDSLGISFIKHYQDTKIIINFLTW